MYPMHDGPVWYVSPVPVDRLPTSKQLQLLQICPYLQQGSRAEQKTSASCEDGC
jgi:hypothetical protein